MYNQDDTAYRHLIKGNFAAIIVSGLIYHHMLSAKLNRHQKNIGDQFSNTEKINLLWLRYLVIGIGVIWSVIIVGVGDHLHLCGCNSVYPFYGLFWY